MELSRVTISARNQFGYNAFKILLHRRRKHFDWLVRTRCRGGAHSSTFSCYFVWQAGSTSSLERSTTVDITFQPPSGETFTSPTLSGRDFDALERTTTPRTCLSERTTAKTLQQRRRRLHREISPRYSAHPQCTHPQRSNLGGHPPTGLANGGPVWTIFRCFAHIRYSGRSSRSPLL